MKNKEKNQLSEPFKIYRVYFGYKKSIEVTEKTIIGETNKFWILAERKMSKNPEWDGSSYSRSIVESADHLLSVQEKKVSQYINKLYHERDKLTAIETFIKDLSP